LIYCKNFYKCYKVPPLITTNKKKIKIKNNNNKKESQSVFSSISSNREGKKGERKGWGRGKETENRDYRRESESM
jgi:hypothetical protein